MKPEPRTRELPLADLEGAEVYSAGWVEESPRTFTLWLRLQHPPGALALAVYELGLDIGQDTRPRVVYESAGDDKQ